ncbi:MAG: F0F1 ATP synthase subunit A, partial [Gemmatimonadota bacterium]
MITPLVAVLTLAATTALPGGADLVVPTDRAFVQEHSQESPGAQAADEGHGEESAHEEWGPTVMAHHVADSDEIEFFAWTIHLPEWEPIRVGRYELDMSPSKHTVFLWIATVLTIFTVWTAARRASRVEQTEKAPRGFLNMFEAFYIYLRDEVALANIGHGGERFVPYVVTLFFFILYSNLLGLIPYGASATGNIMVTAALAIVSLVIIETAGFIALGPKGYLGTIFYIPKGLPGFMVPIMLVIMTPVELIGKLAKPFALAIRLFANMMAGHFVLLALL